MVLEQINNKRINNKQTILKCFGFAPITSLDIKMLVLLF
jgi:hypothetical protein